MNEEKTYQKKKNSKAKTTVNVTGKIFQISKENKKTFMGSKRNFNNVDKHDKFC